MTSRLVGVWFLLVGASAALTHVLVFALTKDLMLPELANALGFAVAFGVSFGGHRRLSFQDTKTSLLQSLRRFAVTAVAGFVCNELVFMLMLRGFGWTEMPALLLALVLAAGQTFVLSRFWAFAR
ncbi:MAG: putative flippase GtrA [Litorivivens sp.]|jgi:putative flippase GtrA